MKALIVRSWLMAYAQAAFIVACVSAIEAEAQISLDDSSAAIPVQLDAEDWRFVAHRTTHPPRISRLKEWTETLSDESSSVHLVHDRELELFAQLPGSSGLDRQNSAPENTDLENRHLENLAPDFERAGLAEPTAGLAELRADFGEAWDASQEAPPKKLIDRLLSDQLNFYAPESLLLIGGGLAVGGAMANTSLDRNIQKHLQSSLRNANTDEWLESLHANKELGDGTLTLPVFAGAWIAGGLLPKSRASEVVGTWGEKSLRGFVVGAPPLLMLQLATGGSRPGETMRGSEWQPFHDDNGVSGHSFMGALPFITAAKMTDSIGWKSAFYAASTLAPLSRAADAAHYPSQIALGWWMAYISASAVHATERPDARWRIYPTTIASGSGMALEYRF